MHYYQETPFRHYDGVLRYCLHNGGRFVVGVSVNRKAAQTS